MSQIGDSFIFRASRWPTEWMIAPALKRAVLAAER
jgi:hypothetical protein